MEDKYEEDYNEYTVTVEEYRQMKNDLLDEIAELHNHLDTIIGYIQDNDISSAYEYCVKEKLV